MFDRLALKMSKPAIDGMARLLAARGISANQVTLACFAIGMIAVGLIALGFHTIAIMPLLLSRLCDGLDGAVARASLPTNRGAFLDIVLDFVFYGAVPLAFAFGNPAANALAAAILLASFIGTGTSFLAYAIVAEKLGHKSTDYPNKSFYYLGGLTEGAETIAIFVAMCWWPQHFVGLALFYATLCLITTTTRIVAGWNSFGS